MPQGRKCFGQCPCNVSLPGHSQQPVPPSRGPQPETELCCLPVSTLNRTDGSGDKRTAPEFPADPRGVPLPQVSPCQGVAHSVPRAWRDVIWGTANVGVTAQNSASAREDALLMGQAHVAFQLSYPEKATINGGIVRELRVGAAGSSGLQAAEGQGLPRDSSLMPAPLQPESYPQSDGAQPSWKCLGFAPSGS